MPIDPSRLRIVHHPAAVLRAKATGVAEVGEEVRAVAERMIELMEEANGIGLAAPQVGLSWRMFVCDVPPPEDDEEGDEDGEDGAEAGAGSGARVPVGVPAGVPAGAMAHTDGPLVFINPLITGFSRDLVPHEEGCLSLPKIWGVVRRPSVVMVSAVDGSGGSFSVTACGMLARCIQHEVDHLDGVLILDKMAQADRLKNRSKVRELEAAGGGGGAGGSGGSGGAGGSR